MTRVASPPTVLQTIEGPDTCEMCGTPGLKTELVRDPFIYGTGPDAVELSADVPVHTCARCEVSFVGEAGEVARHEVVCRHLGVLTPDEIRQLRDSTGMSRDRFASLTGFGTATLARWERGDVIQNVSSDRFLRLLAHPGNQRRLRRMRGWDIQEADVIALSSRRRERYAEHAADFRLRDVA